MEKTLDAFATLTPQNDLSLTDYYKRLLYKLVLLFCGGKSILREAATICAVFFWVGDVK